MNDDSQYQTEVRRLVDSFRDACEGHEHQQVLHAIAGLLCDCVDSEFFEGSTTVEERIERLMGVMRDLVTLMVKGRQ